MSNYPVGRRPRSADLHSKLRLAALAAVMAGVVLLAAAAFVLSYEGIHQIALRAGVSAELAKLYPVIFDAMLVIAGAAALALRGAGWWARFYAWGSLLILLAAVAVGNAVYATGTTLPAQPTQAAVAVTPWVLLLMAFGLLLEMLRHFRKTRGAAAKARAAAAESGDDISWGGRRMGITWAGASGAEGAPPRAGLDELMEPRAGQPPAVDVPDGTAAGDDTGHPADPVSYGEETGYVHPDSYQDEGEYSPHGDSGGPGSYPGAAGYLGHAEPAGDHPSDSYLARHGTVAAEGPAGETAPGTDNGLAAGGGPVATAAVPGPDGTAEAGQAGPGDTPEPAGAEGPGLERMRSTPTRPEE